MKDEDLIKAHDDIKITIIVSTIAIIIMQGVSIIVIVTKLMR